MVAMRCQTFAAFELASQSDRHQQLRQLYGERLANSTFAWSAKQLQIEEYDGYFEGDDGCRSCGAGYDSNQLH